MAKRNLWTDEEVKCFLDIMKEKKVLKLLDGKKYTNKNIYKMIESEMREYGHVNKNTDQIILKWRKLKSQYIEAKNKNKISGSDRAHCPFEDELSEILEARPVASFEGVDSSASGCSGSVLTIALEESSVPIDLISSESSCEQLSHNEDTGTCNKHRKRRPYEKAMSRCTTDFLKGQEQLQNAFFDKQKELVKYEHQLQQQHDKEVLNQLTEETKKMLEDSRNFFLSYNNNNNSNDVIIFDPSNSD